MLMLAMPLAACGTNRAVSVADGEARAIAPPQFEIRGKTANDQIWIDETIEAGVRGLEWPRPQPRPPEWDAKPVVTPAPAPKVVIPLPKRRPLWREILSGRPQA